MPAAAIVAGVRAVTRFARHLLAFRHAGDIGVGSAIDLHFRYQEVSAWFAGAAVYPSFPDAMYPPVTYLVLWPFLGWMGWPAARTSWIALSLLGALGLSFLFVRESGARGGWERLLAFSIVPAAYGTAITIDLGQLGIFVLLAICTSVLVAVRSEGLPEDAAAAFLFVFALAKPTIGAPFYWLLLFLPRRARPALLAAAGYVLATVVAVMAQPFPPSELLAGFLHNVRGQTLMGGGYGNLQDLLGARHLPGFGPFVGGAVTALLGLFVYLRRRADPWVLLGLTGLVTRMLAYHRIYDDILVLFAFAALMRLAFAGESQRLRTTAGAVLALLFAVQMLPTQIMEPRFGANSAHFQNAQVASWIVAAAFLAVRAWFDPVVEYAGAVDSGRR